MPHWEAIEGLPRIEGPRPADPKLLKTAQHEMPHAGPMAPATHMLTNILPQANGSLYLPSEGVYVGEGLTPVPAKLATKIQRGDMGSYSLSFGLASGRKMWT